MVAFRKLFPVLAVFALLLGANAAYAQVSTPFQCTANAGVPPVVRSEGYTELVGDIVITCTGGNAAVPFNANFALFLNTNITSRLIGDFSEALLMIDDPGAARFNAANVAIPITPFCVSPAPGSNPIPNPACNPTTPVPGATYQQGTYTVFRATRGTQPNQTIGGVVVGNENLVTWNGIPVIPPGTTTTTRTFRITNVRANAAGLGSSQTLIPTQIVAYVSVSPSGSVPIDNPQQVVGFVQQGLLFDVRNCANSGGLDPNPIAFAQCESQNVDFFNDPVRSGSFTAVAGLRYREGFVTAFKPRISPGAPPTVPAQATSLPGVVYNSESGFVRPETGSAGIADTGTRLAARFVNIPANVRIFVSLRSTSGNAVYVTTDAAGSSGAGALAGSAVIDPTPQFSQTSLTCGSLTLPATEVPIVNGTGVAVWEILAFGLDPVSGAATTIPATSPTAQDTAFFLTGVAYRSNVTAGAPALGTGQIIGNFAPFYGAGAAERAASGLPIPRFTSSTTAVNEFRISACVTNLLFPYVTNWANFDTGLAIANTSLDPFGTAQQAGRCTMNYYGRQANGNPPVRATETTDRDIPAGDHLTMVLSSGGTFGLLGNANFQGYIIAQCAFRYAHGFAFITDGPIGQARVAEGYLALILDAPGTARTGQTSESLGN